ncbi:MAG TPA: glycoside hydrolase, partial [Acidobacteriaceae bacterium]
MSTISAAQTRRESAPGGQHTIAVDYAGVIGRSDIVLERPNLLPAQAMPLGNGRLGAAVWAADGLTAQLNRVDTLPDRLPVAHLHLPGLARLTEAKDYHGRLGLYDAVFTEQGGGMRAEIAIVPETDMLIVDVTGADAETAQKATISLPAPRRPRAEADGKVGVLSESWADDWQPGSSGRQFGSLAAVTAQGRDVVAAVDGERSVTVSFKPNADGHFRLLVAAPHYSIDTGAAKEAARVALGKVLLGEELQGGAAHGVGDRGWWHNYWRRAGYMKITSADGVGNYMENLRTLYLYSSAAQNGAAIPGSQAGVADIFSAVPTHMWDPGAFWHWNLRMQIAANLSAGVPEMNAPYFNLYLQELKSIESWTASHMDGRPGICVPETMRFNGRGIEFEDWGKDSPGIAFNCDAGFKGYYNARTVSTGAEIGTWIWKQYLATGDRAFLQKSFPVMTAAARFLMAYEAPGPDGLLHTHRSNAHETQWDVDDPVTDLCARQALYQATLDAAGVLQAEAALQAKLRDELKKIPPLPRTEMEKAKTLLTAADDARGKDVIAVSYQPAAENHNVENIGLEPVWPWDLVGDDSPLFELERRTYAHRPYPVNQDWSFDPIQAARLGLRDEVESTLVKLTEHYQSYINGLASWGGTSGEFYVEQQGVVAAALDEALVQDYDGIIRVNPAMPKAWDVDGQIAVRGKTRVDVSVRGGEVR